MMHLSRYLPIIGVVCANTPDPMELVSLGTMVTVATTQLPLESGTATDVLPVTSSWWARVRRAPRPHDVSPEVWATKLSWIHAALTPWQLRSESHSCREDIFKAAFNVDQLMKGDLIIAGGNRELLNTRMRGEGSLFESTRSIFDRLRRMKEIGLDREAEIQMSLARIQEMTDALKSVASEVPYADIEREFRLIFAIINGEPV